MCRGMLESKWDSFSDIIHVSREGLICSGAGHRMGEGLLSGNQISFLEGVRKQLIWKPNIVRTSALCRIPTCTAQLNSVILQTIQNYTVISLLALIPRFSTEHSQHFVQCASFTQAPFSCLIFTLQSESCLGQCLAQGYLETRAARD